MAVTANVSQPDLVRKSPISKSGVLTIHGYGVRIRVQSGHLEIDDGVGPERRSLRLPRVGHKLRRVVCISEDGFITLSSLKWLADIGVPFVMLDRLGKVRLVTGPTSPSDIRLRRSQATAAHTGVDLKIARELISQKLAGQERVAREIIRDSMAADEIAGYRLFLAETEILDAVRLLESRGAAAYWAAFRELPILFPTKDLSRIPEHWRIFGNRKSPLTGSQRLAVNPPNAILNYLYSLLAAESRLGLAALGLDPGLGLIHVDTPARDSLACDLMEVGRPAVDAYLLHLLRQPLRRDWLFETREGNCRLMASFTAQLSETAPMWARAVAPCAEWIARQLWSANRKSFHDIVPPTHLTQRHKREAKGASPFPSGKRTPRAQNLCRGCGKAIRDGRTRCGDCAIPTATERLINAARIGRALAHTPEARAKQANTQRRNAIAQQSWTASNEPEWLTEQVYSEKIQTLLVHASTSAISKRLNISRWYASRIRRGYRPSRRHWQALAQLVGISASAGGF